MLRALFTFTIGLACANAASQEGFHTDRLEEIQATVRTAVAAGRLPGAVVWLERGGTTWHQALGERAVRPKREKATADTIYDAASLTKVVATTTAVMKLVEQGKLRLDAPLVRHLPAFTGEGRERITLRHLLTHYSGLPAGLPTAEDWHGEARAIEIACALKPTTTPGTAYRYSDVNFILWVDPFSGTFLVFLTNRNHPDPRASVSELRTRLATLAAEAVQGYNFLHVPGALPPAPLPPPAKPRPRAQPVLNGIDVLARDRFARLRGLRVGLVTHASGIDRRRQSTIDLLRVAPEVKLLALFSPEHGLRGELDVAKIPDSKDAATGLPVYSLYGERRAPSPAQLAGLDALVFDLQDVGCRFYTYLSTLAHCLEAAAAAGIRCIVLDRVNPIGPMVEGPVLTEPRSFVGIHEIPLRHGMTLGELALLINTERRFGADLTVVTCEGGNPLCWFDEAGLPWHNPSPNLRNPTAALLYPGVGLLEFCKLSVGRGTDSPFEVIGAPWADDLALADSLNRAAPAGIRFSPVRFTPVSSVFAGTECRGVRLTVTDREVLRPVELGILLATTLHRAHPKEFGLDACLKLLGDRPTLAAIRAGRPAAEISASWQAGLRRFEVRRRPHLLYPRTGGTK